MHAGADPAERSHLLRLFYRNWRPTRFGRWINRFYCWWSGLGLPPKFQAVLEVRGRISGRIRANPVVLATVEGESYLVSILGPASDWVKNVEAARGEAVIRQGRRHQVRLVAVPSEQRAPILREYVRIASSGRKHFPVGIGEPLLEFQKIADLYPVYQIESVTASHGPIQKGYIGRRSNGRKVLLICGILASLTYVGTDVLAGILYPGYSFTAQAVSELFAIGAPTSRLVIPLFTLSSLLLLIFSFGVWSSSGRSRALRMLAITIFGNAINALVLWNFFPMHMRGVEQTFTDTMHVILAVNPFVLLSIGLGVSAFRNWFRFYSIGTIAIVLVCAVLGFMYVPQVGANQLTPWLGLAERIAQYSNQLWQVVLAVLLLVSKLRDPSSRTVYRINPS
jgi:Protein of unknown function (DUF998)/F420H(2)-dependent quinone reductase